MLSKRLQIASNYIDPNLNFADIGCDHGYLAIDAINKKVKIVQLVDNKKGPLEIAKKNLLAYEQDATIIYTLADGLSKLDDRINVVAICGMGGDLIVRIIKDQLEIAKKLNYLILEANSKVENLRHFLDSESFVILDEEYVIDKKKDYQILKVKYLNATRKLLKKEIEFGPILLEKMPLEYKKYLENKLNYLKTLLNKKETVKINEKIIMLEEILNEAKSNY